MNNPVEKASFTQIVWPKIEGHTPKSQVFGVFKNVVLLPLHLVSFALDRLNIRTINPEKGSAAAKINDTAGQVLWPPKFGQESESSRELERSSSEDRRETLVFKAPQKIVDEMVANYGESPSPKEIQTSLELQPFNEFLWNNPKEGLKKLLSEKYPNYEINVSFDQGIKEVNVVKKQTPQDKLIEGLSWDQQVDISMVVENRLKDPMTTLVRVLNGEVKSSPEMALMSVNDSLAELKDYEHYERLRNYIGDQLTAQLSDHIVNRPSGKGPFPMPRLSLEGMERLEKEVDELYPQNENG